MYEGFSARAELEPADLKAYYSYSWAESKLLEGDATSVKDRPAYDWLDENGLPDEKDSPELANKLNGYVLPLFDTWSRQVRNARKVLGGQKYTRRIGRAAGRSIASGCEIERQQDDDG